MALFRNIPLLAIILLAECVDAQPKKSNVLRPPRAKMSAFDRLLGMPPEQRQRELGKLAPARRAQLEDRLEKFNRLPQAQKDRLRTQAEMFQSLPPERQDEVRTMFRRLNSLSEDRRVPVRRELRQLRAMSEAGRTARMNSDEFRNKYSPSERQILENLTTLIPQE
jgi:hypothetical protein